MGVNLRDLVIKRTIDLRNLYGKKIAVDAHNALYQFLAIIRQPNGSLLKNHQGETTSHLSGLFYRTCIFMWMGLKVIYVFDGVSPSLKAGVIRRRKKNKEIAKKKYKMALRDGKIEVARTFAQMTSHLTDQMTEDSKKLLKLLGIPVVQSPSEGEAQAAHIVKRGDADYCASQDYDSLLFGAPKLLRNLTISGRRKVPRKKCYAKVTPEIVELGKVLKYLGITHEQLIDIGILIGTDFNPDGIKGIGPKTALKLIKANDNFINTISTLGDVEFSVNPERIKNLFINPTITNKYDLLWSEPDTQRIVKYLCYEKGFSQNRVNKALTKAVAGMRDARLKTTLDKWF